MNEQAGRMMNAHPLNHMGAGAGACQVCGDEPSMGVASVPGIPVAVAYGRTCLEANAHPWPVLVTNVAIGDGQLFGLASWFQDMVLGTCKRLGVTVEQFAKEAAAEHARLEDAGT